MGALERLPVGESSNEQPLMATRKKNNLPEGP